MILLPPHHSKKEKRKKMLIINTILDNFITNKSQNTNVNKVQNTSNLNMLKVSDYYFTLEKIIINSSKCAVVQSIGR